MTLSGQLALADGMVNEILDVVAKYEGSVPLATAIGVVELVKLQLLESALADEDDE